MRDSAMKPSAKITTPATIMRRAPDRSITQPSSGPRMAASSDCSAAAPDSAVLLQPRSSTSTAT
jgi:hypothetical protein